ncbi:MAG TPA: TetR/AcrR family transcriptional regulator [Steroidobacteraceae bacterium]|nr:TetR/AcrR family transcriptional regulator [Steroidobacteraceae bacterium]
MSVVVNFSGYLQGQMTARRTKKSLATSLKLKIAAIALLESPGFHSMTIDDICAKSKLAKGTFYLHFESKQAITLAILHEFVELQARLAPAIDKDKHLFDNIRTFVGWVSEVFRENMGLQRNLMQLADSIGEVAAIWERHTKFLAGHVRTIIDHELHAKEAGDDLISLTIYLIGNMLDQLLYAAYAVHRQSHLERVAGTPDHAVEVVSLLWYRALCAENPPAHFLKTSAPLLSLSRKHVAK